MHKYGLDTPVAIVDLDIMERNISDMFAFAREHGVQLRPHVKTHKVPEITLKQFEAGSTGITCAKIDEAQVMIDAAGAKDVFIANIIVGKEKIQKLLTLNQKCKASAAVDSVEAAKPISDAAVVQRMKIPILIKVDVGLKRTGVLPRKPAVELAKKIMEMPGLQLSGIYTHEGQVYGASDYNQVSQIGIESGQTMVETAEMMRDAGIETETVSVGSTPSAKISCTVSGITETRPGTYVFNDHYQIKLGVVEEKDCALTILATVIWITNAADRGRAVIDAGTKSFFSDKSAAFGAYGMVKGMPHVILERAYEEHGVLKIDPSAGELKIGDKVEIIPNHVCPAVNLFDELIGVRNDDVEVTWKVTARGKLK